MMAGPIPGPPAQPRGPPHFAAPKEKRLIEQTIEVEALAPFYKRELIVGEPLVVKSGKEGTVYRCRAHPSTGEETFAAKLYRPRHMRSFQNDAIYREGRAVLDRRLAKALQQKSKAGREFQYSSWVEHEYQMLRRLHAAGADIPRPVAQAEGAILMEWVGDAAAPAPPLRQVRLEPEEVRPLLLRVLDNVELLLAHGCVHADLSAFNILYWQGRVVIIDFPQAVDARANPNAYALLSRDLRNVYSYWSRYGVQVEPGPYIEDLWHRYLTDQL
jgi:RIO kinase 1